MQFDKATSTPTLDGISPVTTFFSDRPQRIARNMTTARTISDFKGLYTQSSGGAGLTRSGASDLWLRNRAGVVLHLKGTQEGMTLSLGRNEILIEML
jgi:hypothetical protein